MRSDYKRINIGINNRNFVSIRSSQNYEGARLLSFSMHEYNAINEDLSQWDA